MKKSIIYKRNNKGIIPLVVLLLVLIISLGVALAYSTFKKETPLLLSTPTPTPEPTPFAQYIDPVTTEREAYTILLVGDSMTAQLGLHAEILEQKLKEYYPDKTFGIFNYAIGSTNILTLPDRLYKSTDGATVHEPAILDREFEIVIIESFGHNPYVDNGLEAGLMKQEEILNETMITLTNKKPNSHVIFLATLGPSSRYAKGVVELLDEHRLRWISERQAFIENHIKYAKEHNIPLINIYEETKKEDTLVDMQYISGDFIHPSNLGVDYISQRIADFIFENQILP